MSRHVPCIKCGAIIWVCYNVVTEAERQTVECLECWLKEHNNQLPAFIK